MKTIKLNRSLWGKNADETMQVNSIKFEFAIRKGYATEVIEPIEPKKAEITDYKTKVEPEVKKLRNKKT